MGCIMPVGGAPLAMGWGRGGGADETSGGETPTGRGGRGRGGTPGRGAAMGPMGGMGGMPGKEEMIQSEDKDDYAEYFSSDSDFIYMFYTNIDQK